MERSFDAAVVGTGSAGTQAALVLAKRGRSVAIIDERPFGGTCALRGCDPKKVLVQAARVVDRGLRLAELGALAQAPQLHWPELIRFKRTFTDPVPEQRERDLRDAGVTVVHGTARFADESSLAVGEEFLRVQHVVVASGAREMHVAQGDETLLDSETFMELEEMPDSLLFVGGGYIAFEFAHVAARAGAKVTIINNDAHPLAGFDRDAVARLIAIGRQAGISVELESPVVRVERDERGVTAFVKREGGERAFRAREGVLAAGRAPNLESLDLERGGVERTKKGVKVDAHLQSTSNPRVYAAGDAADAGGLPLTPVAGYTGGIAAGNLCDGNTRTVDFHGLPTMCYTIPPLGSVGLTETQARERGIEFETHAGDMTGWYSTRHVAGRGAYYKTVLEKASGKILGATVLGPHAEEQINVLTLAIRQSLTAEAIKDTLFAYPTGSSDLEYLVD